jgi:hypothetical protein
MIQKKTTTAPGFTIVELMMTITIMMVVGFAIGVAIVDSQRVWRLVHDYTNSDIVSDGYVARKKFDSTIRKASADSISIGENGNWVEVNYCASDSSTTPDSYARFYKTESDLMFMSGKLNPKTTLNTDTICQNVSECKFRQAGRSVMMIVKLDNGTRQNTIVTSAVTHN